MRQSHSPLSRPTSNQGGMWPPQYYRSRRGTTRPPRDTASLSHPTSDLGRPCRPRNVTPLKTILSGLYSQRTMPGVSAVTTRIPHTHTASGYADVYHKGIYTQIFIHRYSCSFRERIEFTSCLVYCYIRLVFQEIGALIYKLEATTLQLQFF